MDYQKLREQMIKSQLIPRGISNLKILDVFGRVEREKFIPEELRADAYRDFPLSIGQGQTISQPYMVALMTQSLRMGGREKVLEIGTGSGYQTAILALLAREVYTVERVEVLSRKARRILEKLGYTNIKFLVSNGTLGWEEYAPYDRIIVTAGAKDIPLPLIDQLRERGIMVIPAGGAYSQELKVVEKNSQGKICCHTVEQCVFVPLIGKYGWKKKERSE